MLKFLTQKLRSQSLNEVQPFQPKDDEDRDSGTESDDENVEIEQIAPNEFMDSDSQPPSTTSSTSDDSLFSSINLFETQQFPSLDSNANRDHNFERQKQTTPSSLSESSDFEQASSEEELTVIERELHKRKWSQVSVRSYSDNASSDDEVRELFAPQPLAFSSSPPRSIQRVSRSPPKLFLANVAPSVQMISTSSPRKRHCSDSPINTQEAKSVMPRPCLDFEKMQQKIFRRHFGHTRAARIVKLRNLNSGALRQPKCFYDPAVFSFRSISSSYNPITPVEEPSCAY